MGKKKPRIAGVIASGRRSGLLSEHTSYTGQQNGTLYRLPMQFSTAISRFASGLVKLFVKIFIYVGYRTEHLLWISPVKVVECFTWNFIFKIPC